MTEISPDTLKARPWHACAAAGHWSGRARSRVAAEFLVPLIVIVVLLAGKAFVMVGVVAGVAAVIWVVRWFSPSGRRWVDKALRALTHWVGQGVALVLLAPAFFVVMTLVRLMNRLTGNDPLLLRSRDASTFWSPSDLEVRRSCYVRNMFCTERLTRGRLSLLPLAALGLALLVAAEVGLRIYGFGTPLLYLQDVEVGFYPKPGQRVRHPGRIITINNVGMRSPDVAPEKTPGHIRILMLGDSTLAGTWVSNEELYSSLVEKKLNAIAGAPVIEVLNMGVNAWGPFHELAFVKKFGTFDADVAVICGPVGDCYRPLYGLDHVAFLPATHPPRFAIEQILYQLCWQFRAYHLGHPPWEATADRATTQARLGIAAYVELARQLQDHGVEVLFEMLPPASEAMGQGTHAGNRQLLTQLAESLKPLTAPVNCAGAIFQDVKSASSIYHDGAHFTRMGHRLYADYLAERLRQTSSRLKKALQR